MSVFVTFEILFTYEEYILNFRNKQTNKQLFANKQALFTSKKLIDNYLIYIYIFLIIRIKLTLFTNLIYYTA